jgi:hypothetical protein
MRRILSTRLGVLAGVPIVMTVAFTGLLWAADPASPKPAAKAAVSEAGAKTAHVREVQQALAAAGFDPSPIDGIMGRRGWPARRGGLDGGEDAQPAPTAGTGEDIEIDTRRIRAAQVHAPGVPAARGLASNWRAVDSGLGRL